MRRTVPFGPWLATHALTDRVRVDDVLLPRTFVLASSSPAPDPDVRLRFELIDGGYQCREITFTAADEGREITSADLRALHIADLLEAATARIALVVADDRADGVIVSVPITSPDEARAAVSAVRSGRRAAKQTITDDLLREVAEVYRSHVDDRPTEAVADRFEVAPRTARLYVRKARDAGLLGESIRGRAGER